MRTICIDFDGVIHSYTSGWQGHENIPDPPVPGALDFIRAAQSIGGVEVVIQSTRAAKPEGLFAIEKYLHENGLDPRPVITAEKPPALIYIDDRGFRFEGTWPAIEDLLAMQPWNKE